MLSGSRGLNDDGGHHHHQGQLLRPRRIALRPSFHLEEGGHAPDLRQSGGGPWYLGDFGREEERQGVMVDYWEGEKEFPGEKHSRKKGNENVEMRSSYRRMCLFPHFRFVSDFRCF